MSTKYQTIEVTPVAEHIGAEIAGVDLSLPLSDEQFGEIRSAFIDHGVVFFRQQDLTPDQHLAFAERWGQVNVNRFFKSVEDYPKIAEVRKEPDQEKNIGGGWHTDHSYDQVPAMGSVLYARELPNQGGDTVFASMYAAYEALSDGLKQTLLGLRAEHTSRFAFGQLALNAAMQKEFAGRLGNPEAAIQDATHPVVIRHPLSGRRALYVNGGFTIRFENWTVEESQPLLDFLYRHAAEDRFHYRFKWEPGSMAIWDNRATHHLALNDYPGQRRLMHRITVEGEPLAA